MRPYNLDERITRKKAEIERLQYLMLPSGIDYARPQVMTSPEDVMTKYAAEVADLEAEVSRLQSEYLRARDEVSSIIDALDEINPTGATILSDYYISHKSMNRIAKDHHYNRQHTYKRRAEALSQAWKIYREMESKHHGA